MKLYVLLPIYNIEVKEEVINTELMDGYKLITNKTFFDKYKKEIISNENTDIYCSLKEDVSIPQLGMSAKRAFAKYILIKEDEIELNIENIKDIIYEEKAKLNHFVLILRLIQKGRCQFNRFYVFIGNIYGKGVIDFSTNRDDICDILFSSTSEILNENKYFFSIKTINDLRHASSIIQPFSQDILIPINYFMQYYNPVNLYDRTIKLAIVLESSVLAGMYTDLNYRLKIRASAFLKQDCQKILDIFYKLRSCIVHNGEIGSGIFKDIRKFVNAEQCSDSKVLFIFLSDYVEPLVRDILYKSFEVFAKDNKIRNYKDLFSFVDNKIIEKITT